MKTFLPIAFAMLAACEVPAPEYEYGILLGDLELELISDSVGVHPDRNVLFDPNNPFQNGLFGDMKFQILADGPIAGFYAFATSLAVEPTGEHQYYTALQLQQIHERGLAAPEDLGLVRDLAIRGYQVVLDVFTGAVTYDVTGRTAFDLMPLAILGIEALGGIPENGWKLAVGPDGELVAVQSGVTP